MAIILVVPAETPTSESFASGAWPASAFNDGVMEWSVVYTNASASYSSYHPHFVQSTGGAWTIGGNFELYDTSDNQCFSRAHTWSAGQTVTYKLDTHNKTYSISGATTGNITNQAWTETGPYWDGSQTLLVGDAFGFSIAGQISSVDDLTVDDREATLSATLAPITSSATAAAALAATASPTLGAITGSATAAAALQATAAPTLGAITSSAQATGALSATAAATLGAIASSATATVALQAQASATLAGLTLAATVAAALQAQLAATFDPITSSAAAAAALQAQSAVTLGALQTGATAAAALQVTLAASLGAIAAEATAVGSDVVEAELAATLGAIASSAAATVADQGELLPGLAVLRRSSVRAILARSSVRAILRGGSMSDLTVGDTDDTIDVTLTELDGRTPIDLTGVETAVLEVWRPGGATSELSMTFDDDRTTGRVFHPLAAASPASSAAGTYRAKVRATKSGGRVKRYPARGYITWTVRAAAPG